MHIAGRLLDVAVSSDSSQRPHVTARFAQPRQKRVAQIVERKGANGKCIRYDLGALERFVLGHSSSKSIPSSNNAAAAIDGAKMSSPKKPLIPNRTDLGNAKLFADIFKDQMRYDHKRQR
jgi:hypothetical protein